MVAPTRSAQNMAVAAPAVPRTPQSLTSETGLVTVVPPFREDVAQSHVSQGVNNSEAQLVFLRPLQLCRVPLALRFPLAPL